MRETEAKISELKESNYADISTPVCCFVTFEEDDGIYRALDYKVKQDWSGNNIFHGDLILGEDQIAFTESSEPTNIIWENRHIEGAERWRRFFIATIIIVILISLSFAFIFYCKRFSNKILEKYPAIDCAGVEKSYGDQFEKWAGYEWEEYYKPDEGVERRELTGVLSCYCWDKLEAELIAGKDPMTVIEMEVEVRGKKQQICKAFIEENLLAYSLSKSVGYMIIGINFVLRLILIGICKYVAKPTESEQTELITNIVFICQFFNTAILLLLVNADLSS